ncbi:FUSC family protein [Methylopila henanensis]|uniref:FUSC family protein n=1 Tax=Methylopila henanensis TaxID=873516 RepID=A0ABW4K622_9HYPH
MSAVTRDRLIFALRATLAALLAGYLALLADLPQASSSMMTVLIVSQPLTGMVLSKAFFRVVGTIVGAVAAVALTAALHGAPELFVLGVSGWIAACVYGSIFLRDAPVSYGALLSGYTAAIIAFPAVNAPDGVFLSALDRVAEIMIGIACAGVFSQLFFPRSAGRALEGAAEQALAAASAWAADTLRGRPDAARVGRDRRTLIATVTSLDSLRVHATFDSAAARLSNQRIRFLHGRLVSLIAMLVSVHDRLEILRAETPGRAAALAPVFEQAADAMALDAPEKDRDAARRAALAAAPAADALRANPAAVPERTLLLRIADLISLRSDLDRLSRIDAPDEDGDEPRATLTRYRDHQLAGVAAASAFAALVAVCAFWIASGWDAGAGAAIFVAVLVSLFGQQDDPAAAAGTFALMTAVGAAAAAAYLFAILPRLEGFETLAAALAPLLFTTAWQMTNPIRALPALAFGLGVLNLMSLSNTMTYDFTTFANTTFASLTGLGLAAVLLGVLRPIGSAWPIRRLVAGVRRDLASAAARGQITRLGFESRMFDLVNGLMLRLDPNDLRQLEIERGALAGVRVGLNALALRRELDALPQAARSATARALAELARHFRRLARGEPSAPPLDRLDEALAAALDAPGDGPDAADVAVFISSIRVSLAQHPAMFGAALPEARP